QLWAAFNSNLTVTHGEKITESYSKLAIQIHDNLLTNASIRSLLLSSEQWFEKKGPLDSLYKLEAISQIARSPAHVEFVLSGLFDHVVNKVIRIGDVSVSALSGRKSAVGKGLVHMYIFKYEAKRRLFAHVDESGLVSFEDLETLKKVLHDPASYRAHTGGRPFGKSPDLKEGHLDPSTAQVAASDMTWLGPLSPVAQHAFKFISDFIYGTTYDAAIRNGLRYNHKIDDVLKHQDVEPEWKKVISPEDSKENETKPQDLSEEQKLESSDFAMILRMQPPRAEEKILGMEKQEQDILKDAQKD
ncbi:Uncharacterized protein SCF082_LOCUS19916, partial [Durusdinium trenchii]